MRRVQVVFDFVGYYIDGLVIGRYGIVIGVNIVIGYIECGVVYYIKVGNFVVVFIFNKVSQVCIIVIVVEVLLELYQIIKCVRIGVGVGDILDKNFINDQVDIFISVQGIDLVKDFGDVVCSLCYFFFVIVDIFIYFYVYFYVVIWIG